MLKATQSSVPPMNYSTISDQIRRELGKRPEQLFARFDQTAFAAASLGQVHRATTRDGREVAVKIQYPGVEQTVEQDLRNLKMLLSTLKAIARDVMRQKIDVQRGVRGAGGAAERGTRLRARGAQHERVRALLADDPEVMIPSVFKELSSRRVLTMTYLDGYPLTDVFGPVVDRELRAGWCANTHPGLAADPGVRRAAHRSASGQLSGYLPSAAGHPRLRIDSPFPPSRFARPT